MATATITRAEALRMLEEAFMAPEGTLTPELERVEIPGWDSMGALMLMAELDTRFNLELTAEASRAMLRVSDVLTWLGSKGCLGD